MYSAVKRRAPKIAYVVSLLLLALIIVSDVYLAKYAADSTRENILRHANSNIEVMGSYLDVEMEIAQRAVMAMASSPWIIPAVADGGAEDVENANSVLDRYNESMGTSVCYLMDKNGTTVASSNRKTPSSFVGKNYSFRPYFKQAISGKRGHYFALGVTSYKRGYYVSYPVRNSIGDIVGVVAIKRELDGLEKDMNNFKNCFFVSPDGVVFLSSRDDLRFKSVFPISRQRQSQLIHDKQFGTSSFISLFPEKINTGDSVLLEGQRYLVTRRDTSEKGWTLIMLSSTWPIFQQQAFAVMSAVFLALLIIGFMFFVHMSERSYQLLMKSEERFHRLASSSFEGIMLHKGRKIIDANERLALMTGYAINELIGMDVLDLVSQEDRDLVRTKIDTGDRRSYELLGRRKDGSTFNAEASGSDLETGKSKLRVVSVRDITESKRSEIRINRINETLINLGTDFDQNIERMLKAAGEVLGADLALYNRLEGDDLKTIATWNLPETAWGNILHKGNICGDLTEDVANDRDIRVVRGLQNTEYAGKEGIIKDRGIKTYVGYSVCFQGKCVGTFCVLFRRDIDLSEGDRRFVSIFGEAMAQEETRRSYEYDMRLSETRYKTLYNSSRDAIMILDGVDLNFVSGNRATLELFGCGSEHEFCQHTPVSLSPEYQFDGRPTQEKALENMAVALEEGVNFFEWIHKKTNGEEFPSTVLLTRMELEGKVLVQATVRDISEQKHAEEELNRQKDLLDERNKDLLMKIQELETAMTHIKKLEGLVPICASCKKIRLEQMDGKDPKSWVSLEQYISDKTDAALTHGLCPDCVERLYGKQFKSREDNDEGEK